MPNCPVTVCSRNVGRFCSGVSCSQYDLYRDITGKCETCGAKLDSHPKCDACSTLCGPGHLDTILSPYRGYDLCGHCIVSWKSLEQLAGRETTWTEFLNPQPKVFDRSHR